jgi:biotin transport system substrate-specific component
MNTSTFSIALVSLFAALVAVFGLIPKIDLPLGVPITMQTLGVMLAGCLLGPKRGAQALLLFLAAVALGLPLLSGGRGGLAPFFAPAAGYLLAWPLGAFVAGCVMALMPTHTPRQSAIAAFVASVVGGWMVVPGSMEAAASTVVDGLTAGRGSTEAPGSMAGRGSMGPAASLAMPTWPGLPPWATGAFAPIR